MTATLLPARLQCFREELLRRGLDGFVVPHADEHQSEYTPSYAERLAWCTGFTGSAGAAVILANTAAIFVDGRYTLQAQAQVDGTLFEFRHLIEEPPEQWLKAHCAASMRIGYDPWLHTVEHVERLRTAVESRGAALVAVEGNPIDEIWTDRPAPPLGEVRSHPIAFTGCTCAQKRARVAQALRDENLDAAIISAPDSVAWLLNVRGGDVPCTPLVLSFAVIDTSGAVQWFVDPRKLSPEFAQSVEDGVRIASPEEFLPTLDTLGGMRVRVDDASGAAAIVARLEKASARVVRGNDPCALPRACKNEVEVEGARMAHRRDGVALCRFFAWLAEHAPQGQLHEIEASDRLEAFRRESPHFLDLSFPTISGAGPDGAIVHYHATPTSDRLLRDGELYLCDSGAQYADGTTDVTRTVAIGVPPREAVEHATLVLKGHIALARVVFPEGTSGQQIDVLARAFLWSRGLDYDHGTGHGVGSYLSVHEGPQRIAKLQSPVSLRPGMILSNEPGYYRAGAYGIRIENLVVVKRVELSGAERPMLGFETLTRVPIDLALVALDMLTEGERSWLNAYHALVRTDLAPLLEPSVCAWLERATASV